MPTSTDPSPRTPPAPRQAGVDTVWLAIENYDRDDYPPKVYRTLASAKAAHPPPPGCEWRYWRGRRDVGDGRDSWSWERGLHGLTLERADVNP